MEPEVHIVEKYFQVVKRCLTIANIKCAHGHEIDLLAINPLTLDLYHIEVRVSTTCSLRYEETKTKKGTSRKDGLDYFFREKFNHSAVREKIKLFFGERTYHKILCIYDYIRDDNTTNMMPIKAMKNFGISLLSISWVIDQLKQFRDKKGSRDDILRLLDLTRCCEQKTPEIIWDLQILDLLNKMGIPNFPIHQ